jgi:hypothetical protein
MNDELVQPAWGVWVDYKIAPPGSYACLVSRLMDNRWTDPEPQWMPAQLRPQLHGEVRVMPYLMPNDPLAAVNALPELLARLERLEEAFSGPAAWLDRWAQHVGNCKGGDVCTCGLTFVRTEAAAALNQMIALSPYAKGPSNG